MNFSLVSFKAELTGQTIVLGICKLFVEWQSFIRYFINCHCLSFISLEMIFPEYQYCRRICSKEVVSFFQKNNFQGKIKALNNASNGVYIILLMSPNIIFQIVTLGYHASCHQLIVKKH